MEALSGKNIARAYKLVVDCGSEATALMELLGTMVSETLVANGNGLPCVLAGEPDSDEDFDEGENVYISWLLSFPLKRKGKGNNRVERYLSFQISMIGDGCDIPGNDEPLLHVYCWESEPDLEEYCMSFPLDADEEMHVVADRLLVWGDESRMQWNDHGWAYAIKLVNINNPGDLHEHVVKPVVRLLQGAPVMQALPDSLPGILRYPKLEALVAED